MVFCANCGAEQGSGGKFCASCGTAVGHAGTAVPGAVTSYTQEELTGTTKAIRDFTAGEPEGKTYGQQKWGLFETHYQRTKGISTDESLREIEGFAKHGIRPGGGGAGEVAGGSGGYGGRSGGGGGGFGSGGGRSGGAGGESWTGGGSGPGIAKDFNDRGPAGGAGAAFFSQHKAKEAAKYKPGGGGSVL